MNVGRKLAGILMQKLNHYGEIRIGKEKVQFEDILPVNREIYLHDNILS